MNTNKALLNNICSYFNPAHLGVYLLISATIWSLSFYYTKLISTKGTITTTGVAYTNVRADYAELVLGLTANDPDRKQSYAKLLADQEKLNHFIKTAGISDNEISQVRYDTNPTYKIINGNTTDELTGYQSSATFTIATSKVDTIYNLNNELNSFTINNNIVLSQNYTSYLYTKLEGLKIDLLEKAIKNAKERAYAMSKVSGSHVGQMTNASQGTFQINRINDYSVSDYGNLDTSSIDKSVRATVTVDFAIK